VRGAFIKVCCGEDETLCSIPQWKGAPSGWGYVAQSRRVFAGEGRAIEQSQADAASHHLTPPTGPRLTAWLSAGATDASPGFCKPAR
jgi:hypothetical protein